MKRLISISCAALALSVVLASVPSFAQSPSDSAPIAKNVKTHKLAQGPAGLNYGAGGGMDRPWTGPASGKDNPISGSSQDPGMRRPLGVPAR